MIMGADMGISRARTTLFLALTTLSVNLSLTYLLNAHQETYSQIWSSKVVLGFGAYFHAASVGGLMGGLGVWRKHTQTIAWFAYYLLFDAVVGWGVRFCVLDAFLGGSGLWMHDNESEISVGAQFQTAFTGFDRRVNVRTLIPLLVVVVGTAVLQITAAVGVRGFARELEKEVDGEMEIGEGEYKDVEEV